MRRAFLMILAVTLLTAMSAYGQQSLGDIARENQEKKQTEDASGTQPKVITNKDLPHNPDGDDEPEEADASANRPMGRAANYRQQDMAQQRVAQQWRTRIAAQENRVSSLQQRIDQMNAEMHSSDGTVQYEYGRYQARQQQRIAQLQTQLDEQRRKLDEMQEAARHAGTQTSVFDHP